MLWETIWKSKSTKSKSSSKRFGWESDAIGDGRRENQGAKKSNDGLAAMARRQTDEGKYECADALKEDSVVGRATCSSR